jgi:glycosyltransferase involved in cell wall biosynthesis
LKIALVTDAWQPQVNGVVTTLVELVRHLEGAGHVVRVIEPGQFATRSCPGYPGIDLAISPRAGLTRQLDEFQPDVIHLATEGPLGWAGRRYCLRHRLAFTTAFHTRFPEILNAAMKIPLSWGYALFRHFHLPSSGVMVPTEGVLRILEARGFRQLRAWTHGVDTDLFEYASEPANYDPLGPIERPLALFVGRVSYEKNIESFLQLDLPGTKVVCGVGPLESKLKARFPHVRWVGLLSRPELARLYAAANLFVFPSRADTFGLVMLEAMACGTPVAAYFEDGPQEVLGRLMPDGQRMGGCLHADLSQACLKALSTPRHLARERSLDFSWQEASDRFTQFLVPARNAWFGNT